MHVKLQSEDLNGLDGYEDLQSFIYVKKVILLVAGNKIRTGLIRFVTPVSWRL